jgi:quercetin dioxygenase-like cupin family protein
MKSLRIHRTVIVFALATGLALTACTPTMAPAAESATDPTAVPTASVQSLLDKTTTTVLGQELRYPTALPAEVTSSVVTLPPGSETGLHRHDAPLYGYMLEGVLTVSYDGGVTKTYRTGDALMEAIGTAHNGANLGSVPVRILVVNFGAEGVANTVPLP